MKEIEEPFCHQPLRWPHLHAFASYKQDLYSMKIVEPFPFRVPPSSDVAQSVGSVPEGILDSTN